MDPMNALRSVDLNLLVVLDALLAEAHVTRAARRVGLTQSAASNALDRLRHLFDDPLLERQRGGMRLTPAALALRQPLRDALASLQEVLDLPRQNLRSIVQTVRILTMDAIAIELTTGLLSRLAQTAPSLTIAILPWQGAEAALDELTRGNVDLVITVAPTLTAPLRQRAVLEEHYLVAMRPDHPAASNFDLDCWLSFPHIVVSGNGLATTSIDTVLASRSLSRQAGLVVPNFLMVPPLLLQSDMIALLPSHGIPHNPKSLLTFPPPIPLDGFRLDLVWHDRRSDDVVVTHIANLIADLFEPGGAYRSSLAVNATRHLSETE
jgi:DNA-binding transcriptional LysR family regulator